MKTYAFIDGQNLYFSTKQAGWFINYQKLFIYLKDKYRINVAYYFLGYPSVEGGGFYKKLTSAGFSLIFKNHAKNMTTKKKGNVDTDIVFEIMTKIIDEPLVKILIISGDGDYKKVIDYLITKNKFVKILLPNKKMLLRYIKH